MKKAIPFDRLPSPFEKYLHLNRGLLFLRQWITSYKALDNMKNAVQLAGLIIGPITAQEGN